MNNPALCETGEKLDVRAEILDYVSKCVEVQLATRGKCITERAHNRIHGLAYLYQCPDSSFRGSQEILREIGAIYGIVRRHAGLPDNWLSCHLAETRELLGREISEKLLPGLDEILIKCAESFIEEDLEPLRYVTHFVSANQYTSTNHVAMYACSVYRIGMLLGKRNYMDIGLSVWDRLVEDQHPDGYWEETTGGPTTRYNNLTYSCAGKMARWTKDEKFKQAAQRGAKFLRRASYPDASSIETIDGRCRYSPAPVLFGDFVQSETPEGRAFVRQRMITRNRHCPAETIGVLDGENVTQLCDNHRWWVDGPIGTPEIHRQYYVDLFQEPAATRKQGPWFITMQGITHLPVGRGFTIDRTSLFSLWHQDTGLIVNGSGEFGENPAQTFRFKVEPYICHIPERTRLVMGTAGSSDPAKITAEYAGGTARLEGMFVSDNEFLLKASVGTKKDRYPVLFTLQLELREGQIVNGVRLGKEKREFSAAELNGRIESGPLSITFPSASAKLVWPHDPYNPYDMKNYRSPPEKYVSLLQLPIGPDGIEVGFSVKTPAAVGR